MEKAKIHTQGPTFSRIVAGAWRWHTVSAETVERLALAALEEGITSFDHADIYGDHGNEEIFGRVLDRNPGLRNKIELITKCDIKFPSAKRPDTRVHHYDTSKEHIIWSVENSLKKFRTNHINLLLIHRPDPLMDPQKVSEAFVQLNKEGKVLHFGVSNFTPSQFRMLQKHMPFPLVTNQIEISLSRIDPLFNGDLDLMLEFGVSPMAWSPLGGGTLPVNERTMFSMAGKYNASYTQMAIAWLLRHPAKIFPVIGTTQPERIKEAAKSIDIQLDRQDWFEMLKWVMGKELP
ncbi:MAG: Oxidoreductase YdhF [Cytophagales bacterium]|jgi:predicted oxidoreductase|nr:aldo/keto reductase [Bacteroidota bacterium]MBS1981812.1 aldo/keto reductase [Bacteroidota bacterium]WHZ07429.1 MAG: Oxidoreductase YdhF [Cytophagales bacterium]